MGGDDLAGVQRFVARAVREGDPSPDTVGTAGRLLRPSPRGLAPHERLDIYREQYWLRHLANLDEDYPTLTWVLGGRDAFHTLARAYLEAHPPRTWDLQRLGADLPAFLEARAALDRTGATLDTTGASRDATHAALDRTGAALDGARAAHDATRAALDALALDAARLDWAFMAAFDAPDSPPFDPRVLASTPEDAWPGARIDLHASLRTLALGHPVHDLRFALLTGAEATRPLAVGTCVVVYRDAAHALRSVAVDAGALALLDALRAGTPLGEACEAAARAGGEDPLDVGARLGGWFQQWTASGWIRGVRASTESSAPSGA